MQGRFFQLRRKHVRGNTDDSASDGRINSRRLADHQHPEPDDEHDERKGLRPYSVQGNHKLLKAKSLKLQEKQEYAHQDKQDGGRMVHEA